MDTEDGGPLVATLLGWRCCCDIELSRISDNEWAGSASVRTGRSDIGIGLNYAVDGQDAPGASLRILMSENGNRRELTNRSVDGKSFSFDMNGMSNRMGDESKDGIHAMIGGNAAAKRSFKNTSAGLSYMPVVLDRFRESPPNRILEWGPGRSTIFFAELFPESAIEGVEHHERWYSRCRMIEALFPGRVTIAHRNLQIAPGQSDAYVTYPLYRPERKFDLVFIDGRLRADCIAVAKLVVEEGGAVIVHDAHRKNYQSAFDLFRVKRIVSNTAILEV